MAKKVTHANVTWEDLQGMKRTGIKYGTNNKPVSKENKVVVSTDKNGVRTIKGGSSSYTTKSQLKNAVKQQKKSKSLAGSIAQNILGMAEGLTGNQVGKLKLPGLPSLRNIAKGEFGKDYKKNAYYKLGNVESAFVPIGGTEVAASKILPKAVKAAKYGKLATSATAGALQGAGLSTLQEVGDSITGESNGLKPAIANIALNTGVGAIGAGVIHGAGKGVGKIADKIKLAKRIKNARNAEYVGETTVRPRKGVRYNPNQLPSGQKLALNVGRSKEKGFVTFDKNGKPVFQSTENVVRKAPLALPEGKLALPGRTKVQMAQERLANAAKNTKGNTVISNADTKTMARGQVGWNADGTPRMGLPTPAPVVKKPVRLDMGRQEALADAFRLTAIEARTRGFDFQKDIGKIKQIFKTYAPRKGDYFEAAAEEYGRLMSRKGVKYTPEQLANAVARGKEQDRWREIVGLNRRNPSEPTLDAAQYIPPSSVAVKTNGLKTVTGVKNRFNKAAQSKAEQARLRQVESAQSTNRVEPQLLEQPNVFRVQDSQLKKEVMKYVGKPVAKPKNPSVRQPVTEKPATPTPKQEIVQPQVEQTNLPAVRGNEPPAQPPTQVTQQTKQLALPQSNKKTYTSRSDSTDINEYSDLKRTIDKEGRNVDKLRVKMDKLASDIEANAAAGKTKQNIKLKQDLEDMKNEFRQSLQELDIAQTRMNELNLSQFHFTDNLKDYTVENIENFVRKTVTDGDLTKLANVKLPRMKNIYDMNEKALKNTDNLFHNNIVNEMLKAKAEKANFESKELDRISKSFEGFKFIANSPESAAIQNFGEGKVSELVLAKKFGEKKTKAIINAAKEFRKMYDEYLDKANSVLRALGEPEIPKRQDYFHHIVELENYFKGFDWVNHAMGYDQKLAPKIKMFGFFKKRTNENAKPDAIGAMLNYLPGVSHTIHMNRMAKVFNVISGMANKEMASATSPEQIKNLTKISNYFGDYAKSIQGIPYSALKKESGLYKGFDFADKTVGQLTRKAQLFGNLSTVVMQAANLPLTAGEAGFRNTGKAILQTLYHAVSKDGVDPIEKSDFFKERKLHMKYWKLGEDTFKDKTKYARFMMMATDATASQISWRAFYNQALEKKLANPYEYANRMARKFNPSREVGDLPMAYQDVVNRTFTPYSYEPMKTMGLLYDKLSAGQFYKLTKTLVAYYLLNQGYNFLMGRSGTIDPIGSVQRGINEGKTAYEKGVRAGLYTIGDIASNTPGVGLALKNIVPDAKIKIGKDTYTFREIFRESDPTRYATNPLVLTALVNAGKEYNQSGFVAGMSKLATGLVPMGTQLGKTYDGIMALHRGGKFKNGKLYFPVEKTVGNAARAVAFGTSATKEGKKFYKTPDIPKPMSIKQTNQIVASGNLKRGFTEQMYIRQMKSLERQYRDEKNPKKQEQINKQWEDVYAKLVKLQNN